MTGKGNVVASGRTVRHALRDGAGYSQEALSEALEGLTEKQIAKVATVLAKARERADGPAMKLAMRDGVLTITHEHENPAAAGVLLMADLGTCDPAFYAVVTTQIANIGSHGRKVDEGNSNFLLSVVRAVKPRDELECLLAVQMGAIHAATMMLARRLNHVDTIPQQDAAERALNKLARTYAMQMETFKRYRTGGQQKVIVEHVTVNEGGQAIVGAVTQGGRG